MTDTIKKEDQSSNEDNPHNKTFNLVILGF